MRQAQGDSIYDVRCTMYDLKNSRAVREEAKQMRVGCHDAMPGHHYKATGSGGA